MKSLFRNTLVKPGAIIALAVAGMLGGGAAQAAGTASNTKITNLATLAYTVGGTTQTPIGSSPTGLAADAGTTTDFLVDNKVNLTVTTTDAAFVTVVPGQTLTSATASQVATFVVTNTGNTVQDFGLSSLFNYSGSTGNVFGGTVADNFDPTACSIKVGAASSPTYTGATAATYIDELLPDTARTVYVVCAIPLSRVDADIAVISLTAEALAGGLVNTQGAVLTESTGANSNTVVDIVFADIAGTDDGLRDAKSSSRDAFKVGSAKLTVTKTATPVCDPFNGNANPKNIPGSYVNYTITIANDSTAATSATLGTVTDPLNVNLTFDPELIVGATAATCTTVALGGVLTSTAGNNVKVVQSNRVISAFKTSASDSDGVTLSLSGSIYTLAIDFLTVLPAISGYTAGELKKGESVSVSFQAKIN